MTIDNAGTINVLGLNSKGPNYIYNGGQTGPLKIGTTDATDATFITNGATNLTLKADGSAVFQGTASAARLTAQTAAFTSVQVGPTAPGTIKTRFSGADSLAITSSYAYYGPNAWGTVGPSGNSLYSMEVDNRILLHNELNIVSDRRIKGDIQPMDVSGIVDSLDAVQYTLNSENNSQPHVGFIAQDVAAVATGKPYLPALVSIIQTDEIEDMHVLDKNALLAVLWQTVKNLSKRVNQLENKVTI